MELVIKSNSCYPFRKSPDYKFELAIVKRSNKIFYYLLYVHMYCHIHLFFKYHWLISEVHLSI